ncbi:MAG TPA: sulfatase-like hydrolase/transferase [Vicinamibacterales bacterium]|nr:sulfatase-like hydrolase/transferase [Vicinamibacterales bacterium]
MLRRRTPLADLHPIANQNVLLITIDTLRADALGAYGGPARTPALDRLAADGVRFDFAHAHAVLTLPSHTSILTGLYPFQHGVRENSGYRLAPNAQTLATRLKRAGYATGAFVGAFPVHSRFGLNVGFDVYDDRFGETRAPTEFVMPERPASEVVPLARAWIGARGSTGSPRADPATASPRSDPASGASRADAATSARADRATDARADAATTARPEPVEGRAQPWFVWVHVFDPHAPYRPPPPFDAEYAGRPYYGEVAATDAALGPLLDDVRAAARPTIVIVTGDHGESLGEHGEATHGLFAYESTLRVPLIIAELGGTPAVRSNADQGEVSHAAARHVDLVPTLLDAVGQPIPTDLPGRSLLRAENRRADAHVTSYFEAMAGMLNRGWAPLSGVLADREKFIDVPIPERYDLATDPAETQNLYGRTPDRDRTLLAALRDFHAARPGERRTESREAAAQLQALGYVSGSAPLKATYTDADDPKRLIDVDASVHAAVEAFSSGRAADAIRLYQQVLARRPDMAIAYRHLAFVEWERGNASGAIDVLQRAIAAGVRNDGIVTQLGEYFAEGGQPDKAIALVEPIAADAVVDPDTLNALGIAYARAGRAADATRTFERVLQVDPKSSIPLENLGVLALEHGRFDEARGYFERAVAADPRSSRAHADLGVVALKAGDRRTAVDEWRHAVQLDPTNYDALYNLGTTLAHDDAAEARPFLEQFLRTAPPAFYARDLKEIDALLKSHR